jgi:hypothetical protein
MLRPGFINRLILFTVVLVVGLLAGCEDEDRIVNDAYTPRPFAGITHTNPVGEINGTVDSDDWRLFAENQRVFENPWLTATPDTALMNPAFPNPASESFGLRFYVPARTKWSFELIDQDRTVLKSSAGEFGPGLETIWWSASVEPGAPLPPGIYRVVYRIGDRIGYGDIEIAED